MDVQKERTSITRIKSSVLFPIISEILESGHAVEITVTGNSMSPFLKEGRDSVVLVKREFSDIRRADIVLAKRANGAFVLHRVYSKNQDSLFIIGDAQQWVEGPISRDQMVATVEKVYRNHREISCSHPVWVAASHLWLMLRHFRYRIRSLYLFTKRIQKMRG